VLNFPTKDHWRSVARLSDITDGLEHLAQNYESWGIESLAVPPLGCGEGQLDWSIVGPVLYERLSELDIPVELYAPHTSDDSELTVDFLRRSPSAAVHDQRRIEPAAIALAVILRVIEREPYRWPIGRTAFQKLAYFATEAGIPTGLAYAKNSFGPFAPGLKRLQTRLVNNGVISEHRNGRMFEMTTGASYREAATLHREELGEYRRAMEQVADLLLRADTNQAEILASAHFAWKSLVADGQESPSDEDVVTAVLEWKIRRQPPLLEGDVADAVRKLNVLGWISTDPATAISDEDLEVFA
jgi:hypothetical protein